MFNSISSLRGRRLSVVCAMLIAAFVFGTMACAQPTTETKNASVEGSWKSTYDSYEITTTTVTYNDGGYGYGWTGDVADKNEVDDASGYVYVKYTTVGTGMDAALVGKYYAFAYKKLSDSAVQMSNAYKSTGVTNESTLDEAKTEFTIDNGYFGTFGSYAKSE